MTSKRLARQLKKAFGNESLVENVAKLKDIALSAPEGEGRDELCALIEAFPDFLGSVDEVYGQLEDKAQMAQRNLEVSSQELTSANANLFRLNQTFDAMVNSLGQGFLMFGPDGMCLPVHSKACMHLLESDPASRPVADVLCVPAARRESFGEWIKLLFEELIDFEDMTDVGPKTFPHSKGLIVSLEFKAVRDREGKIEHVVVIATDRTAEVRAKEEAYKMHAFATMVSKILKDKSQFRDFVQVSREIMNDASRIVDQRGFGSEDFAAVKRGLHTLKGAAGTFGVLHLKDLVHEVESRIASENDLSWAQGYLRGALREVKDLFEDLLSEHKDLFEDVLQVREPVREIPLSNLKQFASRLGQDGFPSSGVEFVDEFIAMPVRQVFDRFDSALADAAKKLGKKVEPIVFDGDDIRIVPEDYQGLLSSLIHLFRNIADHGIEPEAKRRERGKKPAGRVRVSVSRINIQGRSGMSVAIEDDGNGIDVERIKAKMHENGLGDLAKNASAETLMNQIFSPGFSTAKQITEFSGRGVGLDAVRTEVERLGGRIAVASEIGRGTRFTITIPLVETPVIELKRNAV